MLGSAVVANAFNLLPTMRKNVLPRSTWLAAENVEVCGFKDCRRAGGGARLQKLVNEVLTEKGLEDTITVEKCDCQGECGYGPNLLVDGKLFNGVKTKDDIMKVLGLEAKE